MSSPGAFDIFANEPIVNITSNIQAIIDALQAANPSVIIIIEQTAPIRDDLVTPQFFAAYTQLNQFILSAVSGNAVSTSKVIAVDMFTGFTDDLLASDGVHYNEAGAAFIADRYYKVLETVLVR